MNYIGISAFDTANGPGVRVSLFVSGCSLHCKGCFNPESWDFCAGRPFTNETLNELLKALEEPYIDGLSLLGGDPLEPKHVDEVCGIVKAVRARFGSEKTSWLWTGRKYENVQDLEILKYIDVIVDGPFIEKLKVTQQGAYFGSTNQRLIHLHPTKSHA